MSFDNRVGSSLMTLVNWVKRISDDIHRIADAAEYAHKKFQEEDEEFAEQEAEGRATEDPASDFCLECFTGGGHMPHCSKWARP